MTDIGLAAAWLTKSQARGIPHPRGRTQNSSSGAEADGNQSSLTVKFRDLVEPILQHDEADRLLELCWALPELQDVAKIALASVPR
jgi:hypothetical protein